MRQGIHLPSVGGAPAMRWVLGCHSEQDRHGLCPQASYGPVGRGRLLTTIRCDVHLLHTNCVQGSWRAGLEIHAGQREEPEHESDPDWDWGADCITKGD